MAYISQLKYENAPEKTKKVIDEWVKEHGPLTNMKETLIHSLPAFHALMEWFPLEEDIESFLGERAVNFFCYAISTTNDCLLCSVFFKKILDDAGIDFETFDFTEEEKILIDYGRAIVKDANSIPPEIFDRLHEKWNEEQIVSITAFATIMIATNIINKTLQIELDEELIPYSKRK
ncbi:carboxymuconolactone decarboxylase family protein [Butyrivibrio sp. AE3006]|jgi:hypothetical protein|uniref:carboxymuconolactone decarboxylase family protein n=1 Tax=Butyrivibrio sp. AE3006 TaxID=1280673 RepID=UPI00040AE45E|nr:hypothetical protein [Butyrivibrio sp. AE3006]